jgi:hypothetical protein
MSVNLKKMLFNRVIRTIRYNLLKTYHGILNDIEYYHLCLKLKLHQYVPKYFTRTAEEHNEIRLRIRRRQDRCSHLKGSLGSRTSFQDFNVMDHIYINGSRVIGCLQCRKKWTPQDREWKQALYMTEMTSNNRSSSERVAGIVGITAEGKRTVRPIETVKE